MPVIMAITGEWDFCLPFILLLEHLSQVFELHLQVKPLSCHASTTLAGFRCLKVDFHNEPTTELAILGSFRLLQRRTWRSWWKKNWT